jgi:two-component system NarL family sensor kinase
LDEAADPLAELLARVGRVERDSQGLLEQLAGSERRYRALAKAVWQVQEEERRRLSRELHDGLGQDLTALKNQLELLVGEVGGREAGGLAARLAGAVEVAARALHDTRELSRLLRPPILDDLGLVAALGWLARTLRESAGFEVQFVREGLDAGERAGELRWAPDFEILVFRVAQEALTNALKHSGAGGASLRLARRGGWLELEVADSGRGFDPARALDPELGAAGSGLRGMRDRLDLYGGRLKILSAPGQGTRVLAAVPLGAAAGAGSQAAADAVVDLAADATAGEGAGPEPGAWPPEEGSRR